MHKIINWYVQRFPFPKKGWKYFFFLLKSMGLDRKLYLKKIRPNLFLHLTPFDHIQQQLFWYGHYERKSILMWETLIQQDSVVCDIGANIGYYSLIAASKASSGKIFSFEPSSYIFDQLSSNIELNGLQNIIPCRLAISNKKEVAVFYLSGEDNIGMSGLHPAENFSGFIENVASVNFQEWKEKEWSNIIHFIKIDVEGAEMKVLTGMSQILKTDRPVLFIEVIDQHLQQYNSTVRELFEFLWQKEYNAFEIIESNKLRQLHTPIESEIIVFAPREYCFPLNVSVV